MTTSELRTLRISAVAALLCIAAASTRVITAQDEPPQPPARGHFGPEAGERGPMGPPPGQPGLALERLSRELGITDTQKAIIDALLTDQRNTLSVERETLREARQALDAAVLNVPTDDGLLQAEVQQISTLEAQLALARARTQAKIFQLLNTEQQAKARQLITEMEQHAPRRGGRG